MSEFFNLTAEQQSAKLTALAEEILPMWSQTARIVRLIKFRENAVFEVALNEDSRAALRIHRQGYHTKAALISEFNWTKVLAASGLQVPEGIPTLTGLEIVEAQSSEVPGVWFADMLRWVDGEMLGEVGVPLDLDAHAIPEVFFNLGQTMAHLHTASRAWHEHDAQPRHRWDLNGFVGETPLWGRFWELEALTEAQRAFFESLRDIFAHDLRLIGESETNFGLIHADLVPENVMLKGTDIQMIDFDDAGFGWYLFEIATALFWLMEEPEFETMTRSLIDGYQSICPLSDHDLNSLNLFFALRSTTYLGWVHTRKNTAIAQELTPIMIETAEQICRQYLDQRATEVNAQ